MPGGPAELREWALGAGRLWIFLDYDGTLADFAEDPGTIEQDHRVVDVLSRLVHGNAERFRVAVLSGRALGDLSRLVPVAGLFLGGVYGLELLTPAGEKVERTEVQALRRTLDELKLRWEDAIHGRKGFYLEDKRLSLALHSRWAEAAEAEEVTQRARQAVPAGAAAARLRILGGHRFLEVAPSLANKGSAVSYLLQRFPLANSKPLYVGDDDKDEEAFPVIRENGGATAKVLQPSQASRPTSADFLLESPAETLRLLEALG